MAYDRILNIEIHNLTINRAVRLGGNKNILHVGGLSSAEYKLDVKDNALFDGVSVTGAKLGAREISLRWELSDYGLSPRTREELIHMFSPKHEFLLYVRRDEIIRRINARVTSFVIDPVNLYDYYISDIEFICPDPYFLDENDTVSRFRIFEPLINAPFIFLPEGAGLTAGMQVVTDGIHVNNAGDADFGIRAEITVVGGDVINPAIWRGAGAYVRVITTLHIGDVMIIDTRRGNKGIWVKTAGTGELIKVLRYDPTSTWFTLAQGGNFVSFKADDGAEKAETTITYSNRWLGV